MIRRGDFFVSARVANDQCMRHAGVAGPCALVRFLNTLAEEGCEQTSEERLEIDHFFLSPLPALRGEVDARSASGEGSLQDV